MPGATTRLALPYPLSSDPPAGHTQIQNLANSLDNAAIDLAEGTLAARPAPGVRGRWYYATDVAILYRDSGSTWRAVMGTDVVTSTMIAADAVGNSELAPDAVTNTEVAAGAAIAKSKLANLSIVDADVNAAAAIAEAKLTLASDAAAGTASRRTLGPGATQAAPGNDARFSDQRVPTDGSVSVAKTGTGDNGLSRGSFSAYPNSNQVIAANTPTIVQFQVEEFDVSGWFDTSNGRFTPQVAGYYRLNAHLWNGNTWPAGTYWELAINKNGSAFKTLDGRFFSGAAGDVARSLAGTVEVQANGSTDFFCVMITTSANNLPLAGSQSSTYFQGHLIGRS